MSDSGRQENCDIPIKEGEIFCFRQNSTFSMRPAERLVFGHEAKRKSGEKRWLNVVL